MFADFKENKVSSLKKKKRNWAVKYHFMMHYM